MAASALKRVWLYCVFSVVFILVGLIGCNQNQTDSLSVTPIAQNNSSPSPTAMPLPPTPQVTATATMMAIPTPEPTQVVLPPTLTPQATMTRSQQRPISTVYAEVEATVTAVLTVTLEATEAVSETVAGETFTLTIETETGVVSDTVAADAITLTLTAEAETVTETVSTESSGSLTILSAAPEGEIAVSAESIASTEAIEDAGFDETMADFDEMEAAFRSAELEVVRYAATIENLSLSDCRELNIIYSRVLAAPEFRPPEYRQQAYLSYLASINSLRGGGAKIAEFCDEWLTSDENFAFAPIPAEAATSVTIGTSKSEYFIDQALTQLEVFPVKASFAGSRPSDLAGFWEIDLTFYLAEGVPPYIAQVGGFLKQEGSRITILHTCDRDFVDHITLTDANRDTFRSDKISASRSGHC